MSSCHDCPRLDQAYMTLHNPGWVPRERCCCESSPSEQVRGGDIEQKLDGLNRHQRRAAEKRARLGKRFV